MMLREVKHIRKTGTPEPKVYPKYAMRKTSTHLQYILEYQLVRFIHNYLNKCNNCLYL